MTNTVEITPVYNDDISSEFHPEYFIKEIIGDVIEPIIDNFTSQYHYTIQQKMTSWDITNLLLMCCDSNVDNRYETLVKQILACTLSYYDKNTLSIIQEIFIAQSQVKSNLPYPIPMQIHYSAKTDIIPNCKKFVNGKCDYDTLFSSFAFYKRPDLLGVYFKNENSFDDFKKWVKTETGKIKSNLPLGTIKQVDEFCTMTLDELLEGIALRKNYNENNEPYSFARLIVSLLMKYTKVVSSNEYGIMPFSLNELCCPKVIALINITKHAYSSPYQVNKAWDTLLNFANLPIKVVSSKKLMRMSPVMRIQDSGQTGEGIFRTPIIRFSAKEPTPEQLIKRVKAVLYKMSSVTKSQNPYKAYRMSFAKSNRRDPDDFNKKGISVSQKYKPDIHLYIDTSGSISEENYQSAVSYCIALCKNLDVNLYVNYFSHYIGQCTKLNIKNKSGKQIYKQFQKIPKLTGGTDFDKVWEYINSSKKRVNELSIMITDFDYYAPNHYVKHPNQLYYYPCSDYKGNCCYNDIVEYAESFCKSMKHIDPHIRRKLLF